MNEKAAPSTPAPPTTALLELLPWPVGAVIPLQRAYKSANYAPLSIVLPDKSPEENFKRAWNLLRARPGGESLVMMQLTETSVRFWKTDKFDVYVDCVTDAGASAAEAAATLARDTVDIDRIAEYIFPAFVRDCQPHEAAFKAFEYAAAFVREKKGRA